MAVLVALPGVISVRTGRRGHCEKRFGKLPQAVIIVAGCSALVLPVRPCVSLRPNRSPRSTTIFRQASRRSRATNGGSGSRTRGAAPRRSHASGASIQSSTSRFRKIRTLSRPNVSSTTTACNEATSSRPRKACSSTRGDPSNRAAITTLCRSTRNRCAEEFAAAQER